MLHFFSNKFLIKNLLYLNILSALMFALIIPIASPDYLDHLYRIEILSNKIYYLSLSEVIPSEIFCTQIKSIVSIIESNCMRNLSNTQFYNNSTYFLYTLIYNFADYLDLSILNKIRLLKILQTLLFYLLINFILSKKIYSDLEFILFIFLFSLGGLLWMVVSGHPDGLYSILIILLLCLIKFQFGYITTGLFTLFLCFFKPVYILYSLSIYFYYKISSNFIHSLFLILSLVGIFFVYFYLLSIYKISINIDFYNFITSFFSTIISLKFWLISFAGIFGIYGSGDIFLERIIYLFLFLNTIFIFYLVKSIHYKLGLFSIFFITLIIQLLGLWIYNLYTFQNISFFIDGFQGRYVMPLIIIFFFTSFNKSYSNHICAIRFLVIHFLLINLLIYLYFIYVFFY